MAINLGNLLTGATKSVGAYDQNRAAAQHQAEQDTLSRALLAHQISQQDEAAKLAQALNQANVGLKNAQAEALRDPSKWVVHETDTGIYAVNPKTQEVRPLNQPGVGTPPAPAAPQQPEAPSEIDLGQPQTPVETGTKAAPSLAKILQPKKPAVSTAVVMQNGKRVYVPKADAIGKQAPEPPVQPTIIQAQTPEGDPRVFRVPKEAGAATEVPGLVPKEGGDARSGVQVETAYQQAIVAHQHMLDFEKKLRSHTASINEATATLAARAFGEGPDAQVAEGVLNRLAPDVATYVRNAKKIGVAERLITPRGGSNYAQRAEVALSGAGPAATEEQIDQAGEYRAALIKGLGSHVKPSDQKPAPAASPAAAKPQKRTIVVNGKTFTIPE